MIKPSHLLYTIIIFKEIFKMINTLDMLKEKYPEDCLSGIKT